MEQVLGVCHTTRHNFTRPADTTAYAAGDVVADSTTVPTIMVFKNVVRNGSAVLQHAMLICSANVATKPDMELWLFDTAPAAVADNAAFNPSDAELQRLVAIIPFPTASFKVGGANSACQASNIGIPLNGITPTQTDLYGVYVVRNAYVPTSGEVFDTLLKLLD